MSFKEDANLPLKLLQNLNCTNCNAQFFIKDLTLKTSRYPRLLHCGHSMCESCLQQCLKTTKSIFCQECHFISSSASEEIASECFPFSIYELGSLVATQIYKHEKDKRLALLTKNSDNFNYSVKRPHSNLQVNQSKGVCEECSWAASWYCDNCKSNFCDICWSKVHGLAKSLMKHCKIALYAVENLRNGLKCTKHEKQDLEFFCTGCSTAICSHCVILQHQGEGHCLITLKEKNIEMISKVKSSAEEAEVIKKRMKQTLEKIKLTQASGDLPDHRFISDFNNQIMRNFSRIHGLIQLEEAHYLKKLQKTANEREHRLRALSEQLESQMKYVESLLSQYDYAVKMPESTDLTYLHKQLKQVQNLPCYLISQQADDVKEPKITFDETFLDLIHTYCSIDVPSSETFQLLSSADLPEDYAVEPLVNLDSYEELKPAPKTYPESSASVLLSDVDTLSNSSSREAARGASDAPSSSKTPLPQKVFCERRNYSVRVTYIKNPGEFYVTLNSQRSKQLTIEKKAQELASCSCVWPSSPGKDEIYLVKYDVDKKWYRGRVVERSGRKIEGEECVVIYYLDYGNTEVVPLSRLRLIPADMMEEPPLAVKCKLFDCVPKNGKWCAESTKTMEKILNDYTATMSVMKIHQDFLEVDLSVIYPEGQIGRDIVSVRDALLFLEFSSFVNGTKIPQSATAVKYMHQCLPAVGEAFDAIITHVNSPSDFYLQRTRQDTSYLFKLTRDLQNYYEENSHKGFIYNPSVGMPCAALFSADHKWYRAKIIDMPGRKTVTVFYVDYGNAETVSPTQIRKLNECFVRRPPLALNCALAGIYPTDTEWHVQTKSYLEKCVLVRDCIVQVHGRPKAKQKLKIFLYKRVNNKEICVNTLFVEMGYAAKCSLNSSWIAKAREQEGVIKYVASKEEKNKSDIAHQPQPASDTEKDSLKKNPTVKEQKKKKLSAKKLRELHEHEKQSVDRMLPAEDSDNDVDEYDNIFKVKVNVLSAESPSSVYVTFPVLMEELKNLQSKMNEFYEYSAVGEGKEWAVGSVCAVYHSGKSSWYRGSVLKVLANDEVEVFLKDVAQVAREPASSLRELEPSFMKIATCAVKCHLADIDPPGEGWPSVSSEYLLNELDSYKEVYMTKKGQIENKSLPIELWVKRVVSRGALEPTAKEFITLNKLLVSQGLAIPKQSNLCYAATPSVDDHLNHFPEDFESHPQAEEHVCRTSGQDYDAPFAARWLPPEPLKRTRFVGIPTYVDSDAHIYIHDVELDEEKLMMMCHSLLKEYGDSKGTAEDDSWSPGQACIARYHMDDSWYRGLIVRTRENGSYDVLFVDYGNTETCQASHLRKRIKMQEVPVVAHKFLLDGIEPVSEDGKWPTSVLEILHSLVVDKKCEVIVLKTPPDPSEAFIISLKIMEDGIDVGSFLVDQGLALTTLLAAEIECNTAAPDVCSSDKVPSLDYVKTDGNSSKMVTPYSSLTIPFDCNKLLIKVTTLISENEFFGNIVDEESLSPVLRNVLNKFGDLQEQLTKEGDSQPLVENLVKGEPCCCLCPENNEWCRGEIGSLRTTEKSVCIFYVDHGSKGLVDKNLLHMCRKEWLHLPKMAVRFKLADVKRCPTVSKSIYMKTLSDHLKKSVLFAQIIRDQEVLEVKLFTEDNGALVYQDMIDKNLMKFI